MLKLVRNLWTYRELTLSLARRELIARYKQSLLGPAWALLQPLALMLIFTFVNTFVKLPSDGWPYPVFAYSALLPWTMFQNGVMLATPSVILNAGLIKKIYFPREVLPVSATLVSLFDFMMAFLVLIGLMIYYHVAPGRQLVFLPALVLAQFVFSLGIGFLTSAIGTFKRDMVFATFFMLQIWMYASPVIYPLDSVPEKYRTLYLLNPMAGILTGFRATLLSNYPMNWFALSVGVVGSVLTLVVGFTVFKALERWYADVV